MWLKLNNDNINNDKLILNGSHFISFSNSQMKKSIDPKIRSAHCKPVQIIMGFDESLVSSRTVLMALAVTEIIVVV